jgi:hypothetical protein
VLGDLSVCANEIGKRLVAKSNPWEDVFRSAVKAAGPCHRVVRATNALLTEAGVATAAEDIIGQARRFGGSWDDLVRASTVAARLFR